MDGASKFVSGDAVAGLLILLINLFGGLAIGIGQHGLSLSEAGRIYSLLTIGDGLVAQVPSLLLSLATAIIVTRVTTAESMTEQASTQLGNPTALFVTSIIMAILGMVPGMPHLVFIALSAGSALFGVLVLRRQTVDDSPRRWLRPRSRLKHPRSWAGMTSTRLTWWAWKSATDWCPW